MEKQPLSDKVTLLKIDYEYLENAYKEEDVKEAVKKLKNEIWEDDWNGWHCEDTLEHFSEMINKIFGEKITGEK